MSSRATCAGNEDDCTFLLERPSSGKRPRAMASKLFAAKEVITCGIPDTQKSIFTGRKRELAELDAFLSRDRGAGPQVAILQGIPGIGKTQIARQYVSQCLNAKLRPTCIFWISATSLPEFYHGVKQLLHTAVLPAPRNPNDVASLHAAKKWFEDPDLAGKSQGWLLIVDDMTQATFQEVQWLMPKQCLRGKIIVTSRALHLAQMLQAGHPGDVRSITSIQPLEPLDAVELFLKAADPKSQHALDTMKNAGLLHEIATSLHCIPVLLKQAASFYKEDAHGDLQKTHSHVTGQVFSILTCYDVIAPAYHGRCFDNVWRQIVSRIDDTRQVAADLLRMTCFLDPHRIQLSIISRGMSSEKHKNKISTVPESEFLRRDSGRFNRLHALFTSPEEVQVAVDMLVTAGLVKRIGKGGKDHVSRVIAIIHPLVQVTMQNCLMSTPEKRRDWQAFTARVLEGGITAMEPPKGDWPWWRRISKYGDHFRKLLKLSDEYGSVNEFLCLYNSAFSAGLLDQGRYEEAVALKELILKCRCKLVREGHPAIREAKNDLCRAYLKVAPLLPDPDRVLIRAEKMALDLYKTREVLRGDAGLDACRSMGTLAAIYVARGHELQRAEAMCKEVLKHWRRLGNFECDETLLIRDTQVMACLQIALLCDREDKFREADDLAFEVMRLKRDMLGTESRELYLSAENFAEVMWARSRFAVRPGRGRREAEDDEEEEEEEGEEEEEKTRTFSRDARLFMTCVLQWRKDNLGENHPETRRAATRLAHWLSRDGGEVEV